MIEDRVRFALPKHTKIGFFGVYLALFCWGRWFCFEEGDTNLLSLQQTLMQTGILVLRATDDVFVAQAKYVHPESFSIGELKLDKSPSWQSSPHGLCLKVVPGCFVNWGHCSKLLSGVRSRLGLSPGWCSFVGRWSLQLMYLLWTTTWRSGLSNPQYILRETNWPTTF